MAKLFKKEDLPHFHSTRDTRDRLDLIKDNVQVPNPRLHADRIVYHPGDSAARHYHVGSQHVFVMLEGEGWILTPEGKHHLTPGMAAVVAPEEIHWFENDRDQNFVFVEFWSPPPVETHWISDDI